MNVAIIQARLGSSRLPGKVLKKLGSKTVLENIIDRISRSKQIDKVVVATTDSTTDDKLAEYVSKELGYEVYRGSEDDVLSRFYHCAKENNSEIIIRVTADDPMKDHQIIDEAIDYIKEDNSLDYCSNTIKPTFPEGLDIEVFKFSALEKAFHQAKLQSEREHVTPYIWKNSDIFNIRNFTYSENISEWRWTLDNEKDYEFMKCVYKHFDGNEFSYQDAIAFIKDNFEIQEINIDTIRNEGYYKSLREENMSLTERIFGNEMKYTKEVLETEFRSSKGSLMMTRLEAEFAKRFESKYAVSFNNGTSTMHAILEAANIGPGDEVIVPPLTMSSTTFVVLQCGATPVFADVEKNSFVISPESIKKNVTKKTKAIITVSLYGISPDMDPIMEIAESNNILVIEDNAQCFLGEYKGKLLGKLGHVASYSFQSSKHLTSGEGGMIITEDEELAVKIRRINSLGYAGVGATKGKITKKDIQDPQYSRHVCLGWNYRIPELCAAVALAQVENIDALVQRRIEVAKLFKDITDKCEWLEEQKATYDNLNSYWAFSVRMTNDKISWYDFRDKFLELGGDGIYAAWKLTYLEPMFDDNSFLGREKYISNDHLSEYRRGLCPNAEEIQKQILAFKTNYWNWDDALRQAEILKQTINYFN